LRQVQKLASDWDNIKVTGIMGHAPNRRAAQQASRCASSFALALQLQGQGAVIPP
jgi:hypothetical protein